TGEERTSGGTIENLTTLIDLAIQGNASKYSEHQSASGAKDVIVEDITDILFESRRVLSGKAPDHPRTPTHPQTKKAILNELLHEARALQSGAWHNALLQLSEHCGFSVHSQSPIECLHTLWLGPVKYLAIATVNMIDKDLLRTRLEGLDTDGLDCGAVLRAKYHLNHVVSLTGKEFKLLTQSMPAALPPLVHQKKVSRHVQEAWAAVGRFAKIICAPWIDRTCLDGHVKKI
ncbi:unnamed protein product, partial [Tilletia caries]